MKIDHKRFKEYCNKIRKAPFRYENIDYINNYCVFGALLRTDEDLMREFTNLGGHILIYDTSFPGPDDLADAICHVSLFSGNKGELIQKIHNIMNLNDSEDFDEAIKEVEKLLESLNLLE